MDLCSLTNPRYRSLVQRARQFHVLSFAGRLVCDSETREAGLKQIEMDGEFL
jgi:hypothetical protein